MVRQPSGDDVKPPTRMFADLIRDARNGSSQSLGRLFEACRAYLLMVADRHLRPDLAGKVAPSDMVQETFLDAQRDFARFHGSREDELLAWLGCILKHNIANATRRFAATGKRAVWREQPLDGAERGLAEASRRDSPRSPHGQAVAREEQTALDRAIAELPTQMQRVIHLRYRHGLSFASVGAALNCSADAARKLWARAVLTLRTNLRSDQDLR